ncbi:MAG: glycosyltransferase family 87 protein [Terracidiphilus sp.]
MNSFPNSWPSRFLGPVPKLKDLNLIFWGLLFVGFVLPFSIVIISNHRPPDADFAGFYSLGRILNEHSPRDLYNYELQKQICEEVHPRKGAYGPLPYPPFVGLFFRPFTLLPYWAAYTVWLLASLVLFAFGLRFTIDRFFPQEPLARSLLFALAFSYCPFIAYTAANGQLAAVGFFALAIALREDDSGHPLRSGLALCLCLFKPTMLILIVPMLLVTRRFKTIAGFAIGAAALFLCTTAFEGFGVWPEFIRAIRSFGNSSVGVTNHSFLPLAMYVDLTSFSSHIHGGRSWLGMLIFVGFGLIALTCLARFWWKAPEAGRAYNRLLWAATLGWTLLINVYVPIYDSILVVLSLLITAGALQNLPRSSIYRWFTGTWILILICSWFSVPLSRRTGVQVMTLLFAALGIVQLISLNRFVRQDPPSSLPDNA